MSNIRIYGRYKIAGDAIKQHTTPGGHSWSAPVYDQKTTKNAVVSITTGYHDEQPSDEAFIEKFRWLTCQEDEAWE